MKHLCAIMYVFAGIALGSLTAVAESQQAVQIDFDKVNASIATSLDSISAQSDVIESFNYSFLPETNIDEDKFVLSMALALSKTPWGDKRATVEGQLRFSANLDDDSDRGFTVGMDVRASTDSLAMLKYKVKRISHCDAGSFGSGIRKVLWTRHCEYVNRLDTVVDVAALYDFLADKLADHRSDVEGFKATLTQTIQIEKLDQQVIDLLNAQIEKADKVLDFLNGVTLEKLKDGFRISSAPYDDCPIVGINGITLEVAPDIVAMKGDVKLKFGKMFYAASREVVIDVLKGLEQGEEFAGRLVQYDAMIFENMIEQEIERAK